MTETADILGAKKSGIVYLEKGIHTYWSWRLLPDIFPHYRAIFRKKENPTESIVEKHTREQVKLESEIAKAKWQN